MKIINLLVAVFLLTNIAYSYEAPRLTAPIIDQAKMLSPKAKGNINLFLRKMKSKYGVQLQVLTINSLESKTIEQVSIKVAEQWKLGSAAADNGALLIIAKNDRRMRIEVGQGLEGNIPDAIAKRIIEDDMKPFFKKGDFDRGIMVGVFQMAQYAVPQIDLAKQVKRDEIYRRRKISNWGPLLKIIMVFFFIFFFRGGFFGYMLLGGLGGRRSSFGGGGGFSSGGWSGGGGGFSGGGASGSW